MERGELKHECNELSQDLPETRAAFWGHQLERIQERAERQAGRTSTHVQNLMASPRSILIVAKATEST